MGWSAAARARGSSSSPDSSSPPMVPPRPTRARSASSSRALRRSISLRLALSMSKVWCVRSFSYRLRSSSFNFLAACEAIPPSLLVSPRRRGQSRRERGPATRGAARGQGRRSGTGGSHLEAGVGGLDRGIPARLALLLGQPLHSKLAPEPRGLLGGAEGHTRRVHRRGRLGIVDLAAQLRSVKRKGRGHG